MFFSIIIPSYNRAAFLPKAIDSVLAQTYVDWELIIVDDGSTDNTREVVKTYSDSRIKYIYQQNAERSAARNNGINQAQGDYICFMDSDEYIDTDRLEKLKQCIAKRFNKVECYFTDIKFEKLNSKQKEIREGENISFPINNDHLIQMIIGAPQLCIAKKILKQFQFNPELSIGEDMELLFRIAAQYPIVYLKDNA